MELDSDAITAKPAAPREENVPTLVPVSPAAIPPPVPPQVLPIRKEIASQSETLPPDLPATGATDADYLFRRFDEEVADERAAERLLKDWKAQMPEVNSAYQPSGELPGSALLLMVMGTVIATAAALAAEAVVGALAAGILAIVALCNTIALLGGVIFCFWVVVAVIVLVVALAAPFAAGGWTAAWTTTFLGRWGKNRNAAAAGVFALVSAGLSIPIAAILFVIFAKPHVDQLELFGLSQSVWEIIYWIVAVVGGLVAVATAWHFALSNVEAAKFCEDCKRYMKKENLTTLRPDGLHAIVQALGGKNPAMALRVLDRPEGDHGEVLLFCCPQCDKGYLEVLAHFKAKWFVKTHRLFKPKEENELNETWLAASMELASGDVHSFQVWRQVH